jgi:hypothetical protein
MSVLDSTISTTQWKPGKGVSAPLTGEVLSLLTSASASLDQAVETSKDADELLANLGEQGWGREDDAYGRKAFMAVDLEGRSPQQFRLTVVVNDRGIRLDVRTWYEA